MESTTVKVKNISFYGPSVDVPTLGLYDIPAGGVIEVSPEVAAQLPADHFEIVKETSRPTSQPATPAVAPAPDPVPPATTTEVEPK